MAGGRPVNWAMIVDPPPIPVSDRGSSDDLGPYYGSRSVDTHRVTGQYLLGVAASNFLASPSQVTDLLPVSLVDP